MFHVLDRLRAKPKSYRISVTIITAALLTAGIVSVWLATRDVSSVRSEEGSVLPAGKPRDYPSARTSAADRTSVHDAPAGETPFAVIGESLAQFARESSAYIGSLRELLKFGNEAQDDWIDQ